jgi:hypothetical protein
MKGLPQNEIPPVEIDYSAPNGVHFKIGVINRFGRWRCLECSQVGFTAHEYGDDSERQAKLHAREHSVMCGAGRGSRPPS